MARKSSADTGNAHVRSATAKRQSNEVLADEAQRLLDDPAFQRGFSGVRDGCVSLLENLQHDGSEQMDAYEREITRTLRTLARLKRVITLSVQGQTLRLADFRPAQQDED